MRALILLFCLALAGCAGRTDGAGGAPAAAAASGTAAPSGAATAMAAAPAPGPIRRSQPDALQLQEARVECWGKVEQQRGLRGIDARIAFVDKCVAEAVGRL
jgi:hypothetical protein